VVGNLVGGPSSRRNCRRTNLVRTIGGMAAAAIAEAAFIAVIGGHVVAAAIFGAGLAIIAQSGRFVRILGPSAVFHIKDSGD